jgi:hypothetical protein
VEIQKDYPKLTFKNDGYEKLSKEIREEFSEQMKEVSTILSSSMKEFREFNNFSPAKDGHIRIRMQYMWSSSFKGVGYFDIRHWNPEDHGRY